MRRANDSRTVNCLFLVFLLAQAAAFGERVSAQTAPKIPLPEYFGLYLVSAEGLKEIPIEGDPSLQTALKQPFPDADFQRSLTALGNDKDLDKLSLEDKKKITRKAMLPVENWIRQVARECHSVRGQLGFVFYHELVRPETFTLATFGVAGRAVQIPLGIAPVEGKNHMYRLAPRGALKAGLYLLKAHQDFASGFGSCYLVNSTFDEFWENEVAASVAAGTSAVAAGTSAPGPTPSPNRASAPPAVPQSPQPAIADSGTPKPSGPPARSCSDYELCVREGLQAIAASQWGQSLGYFEEASSLEPTKPAPWDAMGTVYMVLGRYQEFERMEDKALELGGPIAFGVCRERPLWCDMGALSLGRNEVFFADSKGKKIFAVAPKDVAVQGVFRNSAMPSIYFRLRAGSTNYNFDFIPIGVQCQPTPVIQCPEPGLRQQLAISNYIAQRIPKLAAGAFTKVEQAPAAPAMFLWPTGTPNAAVSLSWLKPNPDFPEPLHLGVDFPADYGAPVISIADGEIVLVNESVGKYGGLDRPGGGMFVRYKTDTGQTFYALYAHVENMKPPGRVRAGEKIATIGHYYQNDGKDTPHLHFGVFFGDQLPTGDKWPWRQYVSDPSDNPGWQDPLSVLRNTKAGLLSSETSRVSGARTDTKVVDPSGVWVGTGRQEDGTTWPVRMRIDRDWNTAAPNEVIGTINYLTLQCGGLIVKTERGLLERLTSGKSRCVDGGTIFVEIDVAGRQMTWKWHFPDGRFGADAVLIRE